MTELIIHNQSWRKVSLNLEIKPLGNVIVGKDVVAGIFVPVVFVSQPISCWFAPSLPPENRNL